MRTYGTVTFEGNKWHIETEPQVVVRLKRVFQKISKGQYGKLTLSATAENTRELSWFIQRYPLVMSPSDTKKMEELTEEQKGTELLVSQIMAGDYVPPEFELALQPREYQRIAADLAIKTGRLLLADEVGLGKTVSAICTLTVSENLPALVVTMAHLPTQWEREINKFAPNLRTHIVKKGTPYDMCVGKRGKVELFPDVIIISYYKLSGWADVLHGVVKSVIYDEIQELRRSEANKSIAATHISAGVNLSVGLSVGPESRVELGGGVFGGGWSGPIGSAWDMLDAESMTIKDGYEIIPASEGMMTRGWTGAGFGWKPLRNFIRHAADKPMMQVSAGGTKTCMTTDHSVFVADCDSLFESRADELSEGDIVPSDNGTSWEVEEESPFDVISFASKIPFAQITVDLTDVTRSDLGVKPWQWQNFRKEARYGSRVPMEVYQSNKWLKTNGKVYLRGGNAPSLPCSLMLSDWAYMFGFFLGDGWATDHRLSFAVEQDRVSDICQRLDSMDVPFNYEVRKMKGESSEIRVSHALLARLFKSLTGGAKCYDKRVPHSWIFSWNRNAREKLLKGLIDSDGNISSSKLSAMCYSTSSPGLMEDVRLLVRSLGSSSTLYQGKESKGGVINGRQIIGKHPKLSVTWSSFSTNGCSDGFKGNRHRFPHWKGMMNQTPIRSIEPIEPSSPYVYDLEVEGHPSFSANGLLCHNSATPIFNYGGEIYNVMSAIQPGCLGERDEFTREWCNTYNTDKPMIRDPKAFGAYLREHGLMLRRTRNDVGRELEPLNKIVQYIECDTEALSRIEDSTAELAKIILSQSILRKGVKMHAAEELSNVIRQQTGIGKAPYVADLIRMLVESGESVLVFAWHREVYSILMSKLKDLEPVMYTGSESANQKLAAKDDFVSGKSKVMLMSLRSGAGLDGLQLMCRTVVFAELDWSPAVHHQGCGRIHRDQQPDPVMAYFPVSDHGSDPTMMEVLGIKKSQSDGITDPNANLIENAQAGDGNNIRRLAESFLKQRGIEVSEPTDLANLIKTKEDDDE